MSWGDHMSDAQVDFENEMLDVYQQLPGQGLVVDCPSMDDPHTLCDSIEDILDCIIHLNDSHKWPREKIADWVDSLEDKGGLDLSFKEFYDDNTTEDRPWE